MSKDPLDLDWKQKFERSQRRWGHLKQRVHDEILALEHPPISNSQKRHANVQAIARLNWVLREMQKSPDVIAEAVDDKALTDREVCDFLGFDPTNHHNALACPYCNPEKRLMKKPTEEELAHALRVALDYGFDAFEKCLFDYGKVK
jgi:hypothetical protein